MTEHDLLVMAVAASILLTAIICRLYARIVSLTGELARVQTALNIARHMERIEK